MTDSFTPQLRAFIEARKRAIEAAEKCYDVQAAVAELRELAAPLHCSERFPATWKKVYLELLYRDVAAFVLGFVAIHLEICFSERDREQAFDIFFDRQFVPPSRAVAALTATLSATKPRTGATDKTAQEDAEASITQCIRLLEKSLTDGGVEGIVAEMLIQEQKPTVSGRQSVIGLQVLVSQLSTLPDLVYNRRQRDAPAVFRPRRYFPMLCDGMFRGISRLDTSVNQLRTFRTFADKLTRIGQAQAFVQSWMRSVGTNSIANVNNALLFQSLPESCHEQILLQIANEKTPSPLSANQALCLPKYRLLAEVLTALCANKHFQYIVVHKLLLRKAIEDFFYWRVLVDGLLQGDNDPYQTPLAAVFDVVLERWSQSDFAVNTEYSVNASVCFFIRYSLKQLAKGQGETAFSHNDWIAKLCKGVQDHMSHSLERVRALGMRVGESLSHIIASEKPLDFGLQDEDPLATYGCPVLQEELEEGIANLKLDQDTEGQVVLVKGDRGRRKHAKKSTPHPFTLDPDELVSSDDDDEADEKDLISDAASDSSFDDVDSDSDMSLEAYDLRDDEEDLTARRPVYLKDLVTGLLSDDDREKTETALNEAETLLRRRPRDLNDKAHEVARALLRLEDKFSTPQFGKLRSQALATTCVLAPAQSVPYLCSQALEREQLLQSRIDVLQAMTVAAQELSERGSGYQHPEAPKTLLHDQVDSAANDLGTRTMQSLKTRRWGYRRDPLAAPKRNSFAPYALEFFSPLLFGYVEYMRKHSIGSSTTGKARSEVEQTFLAHLLHALASFVECAGHAPQTTAMAKCLLEFAWSERSNTNAEVRRQVLFSVSRVLLVVPSGLLRQEVGGALEEVAPWLNQVQSHDPDAGCREAAKLLSSFASAPKLSLV